MEDNKDEELPLLYYKKTAKSSEESKIVKFFKTATLLIVFVYLMILRYYPKLLGAEKGLSFEDIHFYIVAVLFFTLIFIATRPPYRFNKITQNKLKEKLKKHFKVLDEEAIINCDLIFFSMFRGSPEYKYKILKNLRRFNVAIIRDKSTSAIYVGMDALDKRFHPKFNFNKRELVISKALLKEPLNSVVEKTFAKCGDETLVSYNQEQLSICTIFSNQGINYNNKQFVELFIKSIGFLIEELEEIAKNM